MDEKEIIKAARIEEIAARLYEEFVKTAFKDAEVSNPQNFQWEHAITDPTMKQFCEGFRDCAKLSVKMHWFLNDTDSGNEQYTVVSQKFLAMAESRSKKEVG